MAADRGQSSRKLASSPSSSEETSKAEMDLAGAYRQHLQLFLQVRYVSVVTLAPNQVGLNETFVCWGGVELCLDVVGKDNHPHEPTAQ